ESDTETFVFGHGFNIKMVRRSRLKEFTGGYADIKTLMSKEHRVVDFSDITQREARRQSEDALMRMRGPDEPGLVALYPIDRTSRPDDANADTREQLDAADDVIGVALVFPGLGDEEAVTYMSADLSRLGMTAEDIEEVEEEDPEAEVAA